MMRSLLAAAAALLMATTAACANAVDGQYLYETCLQQDMFCGGFVRAAADYATDVEPALCPPHCLGFVTGALEDIQGGIYTACQRAMSNTASSPNCLRATLLTTQSIATRMLRCC
jgi:hypothetical protein